MTKQEKAQIINEALSKSKTALKNQAAAEVLPDGRIQYTMQATSYLGHSYSIKVPFAKILNQMHGEDMRRIHKMFGRSR